MDPAQTWMKSGALSSLVTLKAGERGQLMALGQHVKAKMCDSSSILPQSFQEIKVTALENRTIWLLKGNLWIIFLLRKMIGFMEMKQAWCWFLERMCKDKMRTQGPGPLCLRHPACPKSEQRAERPHYYLSICHCHPVIGNCSPGCESMAEAGDWSVAIPVDSETRFPEVNSSESSLPPL